MTAVTQIVVRQHPMLIGDLLLTGPPIQGVFPTVPTVSTSPLDIIGIETVPRRLHQKIALIGDNIAIGWAGKFRTAIEFFGDLHELSKTVQFDEASFHEYLERQSPTMWNEISLVGYVADVTAEKVHPFGCSQLVCNSPVFGYVGLLGTGAEALRDYISRQTITQQNLECEMDPLAQVTAYGLTLAGNFLSVEVAMQNSLQTFFGGGYEIAILHEGKFYKRDNVTYLYWIARRDGNELTLQFYPSRVFRYYYCGDLLVIRTAEFTEANGKVSSQEVVLPIAPPYRHLTPQEKSAPPVPKLNAPWMCHHVLVLSDKPPVFIVVLQHKKREEELWVQFQETPEQIGFSVHPDFPKRVLTLIAETLGVVDKSG